MQRMSGWRKYDMVAGLFNRKGYKAILVIGLSVPLSPNPHSGTESSDYALKHDARTFDLENRGFNRTIADFHARAARNVGKKEVLDRLGSSVLDPIDRVAGALSGFEPNELVGLLSAQNINSSVNLLNRADTSRLETEDTAQVSQPQAQGPGADQEFNDGSGIQLKELTALQIENLATLAKVWGFLKYNHPVVTAGMRNWDYDLFRVMPAVLRAHSRVESDQILVRWVDSLGPVSGCHPCASLDDRGLKLRPDLSWIKNFETLGVPLSHRLQNVYANRIAGQQRYVTLAPGIGNPIFINEASYPPAELPDSGIQLLSLFRFWNIIENWYPDRDVIGENWTGVLAEFIPRVALASNHKDYVLSMISVVARLHDTHANLSVIPKLTPPAGACSIPVNLRFIEGKVIVTNFLPKIQGQDSGFERGDEITAIDSVPVSQLFAEWEPYYGASNDPTLHRSLSLALTKGDCGPVRVEIRRGSIPQSTNSIRVQPSEIGSLSLWSDLAGPTFRLLSPDIAYLKLSSVREADVGSYIEAAKKTRGMIIDIRNYPAEFVVFALGNRLVTQPTPFAMFSSADLSNPGAFHLTPPVMLTPDDPHYRGKVVILVDEWTMSQAEYTTMAFRSTPNAIVIGSMTAGADGNVSTIPLPGNLSTLISGLGVFYPDGSPTQRVGIHIDVDAHATLEGVRSGRDEVLETAIHQISPELSYSEIELLAKPDRSTTSRPAK
ncbi:S41 family peptidase [Tunturiibacter psychrotolerans]|uniref:S41 family peptidase n=1 Tax=Tunturiibacter psychrotolerans TaxID=3069686 RepID=UPI003D2354B9